MSIRETITSLGSLSDIDARIAALEAELAEARASLDDKASLKQGLVAKIDRLTESISEMETTRNELVSEMRQTSLQVDRSREKFMRCRNEREANAVQREQEELRRVFRERDHETQKLAGLIDAARGDLEAATKERDDITAELDATRGDATTKIRRLEAELSGERAQREQAISGTDKSLLRRYEAVRQRRGSGLADVKDGTCVACHISLPPMLHQRILHQAELFQCPSCQRILVPPGLSLSKEEPEEEPAETAAEGAEDEASSDGES